MITMSPQEKLSLLLFVLVLLVVYGLETLLLGRYVLNRIRRRPAGGRRLRRSAIALHVLAGAGIVCLLYGYFIEPRWIDVNRMTIETPKLMSARFRIVQISDLHCDRRPRNEQRAVEIINRLQPDIVVATGDYLNDVSALPRLRTMLQRIEAPLGKFAVKGNFEAHHWPDLEPLETTEFHLLEQETAVIAGGGESISISGLGFGRSEAGRDLLGGLPGDRFDIFLFHTPDVVEDVADLGVDLYLCGHTHGGQVALPLYGALVTFSNFGKRYESGMYRVGDTVLYVNRGLGLEPRPAPQVRFLARPEIAVFDIVPAGQKKQPAE